MGKIKELRDGMSPMREVALLLLAVIVTAVLGVHVVHGAHLEWEQHSAGAVQAAAEAMVYRPLHARSRHSVVDPSLDDLFGSRIRAIRAWSGTAVSSAVSASVLAPSRAHLTALETPAMSIEVANAAAARCPTCSTASSARPRSYHCTAILPLRSRCR